jgi:kinesin family protein 11
MSLPGAVAGDRAMNVKVAVRCRPLNEEERRSSQPMVVTCDNDKNITVSYGPTLRKTEKTFAFDRVFGTYSTQSEVFDAVVLPIVEEALDGFNCTIFAYGQTGTGKTHTMEGDLTCAENAGIVPRSVKAIFEQLGGSGAEFTIRVSFLELYNEELQDLLSTDTEKKLRLCEDVKKGLICQNLEEVAVLNVDDIFDILTKGIKLRQTAETMCNKNSSRSHSIFTVYLQLL